MTEGKTKLVVPHNFYLKLFVMEAVAQGTQLLHFADQLPWDVIIIDEAQDMNPVTLQVSVPVTSVSYQRCTNAAASAAAGCCPPAESSVAVVLANA